MNESKFLYTRKRIAAYLDVSIPTLMRFIKLGAPVAKDEKGKDTYWTTSDVLMKWYNEHLKKELAKIHTKNEG